MLSVTSTLKIDGLTGGAHKLGPAMDTAVDATAEDVQLMAGAAAPKDTRSLTESIYKRTPKRDDYAERVGAAQARNPRVKILAAAPKPTGHAAVVAVAAGHGVPQEYGTRHMPAHPFWTQAVERGRVRFRARMQAAIREVVG
jgi:hypothetical protein